jgi:hypothetical protein
MTHTQRPPERSRIRRGERQEFELLGEGGVVFVLINKTRTRKKDTNMSGIILSMT